MTPYLISIDMGIRSGVAVFSATGQLMAIRSANFGSLSSLRRAVFNLLAEFSELKILAIEGGGAPAEIWKKEALRRNMRVIQFQAETWRASLLLPRQQRNGPEAKRAAIQRAMEIIRASEISAPKTITDDLAEAIMAGIYALSLV